AYNQSLSDSYQEGRSRTGPSAPDVSEPQVFAAAANGAIATGNTLNINIPVPNEAPRYSGRIDWMRPQINRVTLIGAMPRATATWTASTDGFAGVWQYEYVVSREPDANAAFGNRDSVMTTTDTQVVLDGHPMLSYTEPTYFHVRGVDNGRAVGPASTLELLPEDKSAPTRPTITLRPYAQSIAVHVIQLAHDPESGIAGYQLALGTQPGAQDIRPFPADSTAMDIEHNPLTNLPTKVTFSKNGLPASGPLYVSIRAVNGQGRYSWRTASGPLRMDDTPARVPGAEILSLTRSTSGGLGQARERMRVQFSNIRDPESGITWARVQEVRVGGKRIAVDQFSSTLNVVPPTQTAAVFSNGRYTVDLTLDQSDVVQSLEGLFLSLLARTKPENLSEEERAAAAEKQKQAEQNPDDPQELTPEEQKEAANRAAEERGEEALDKAEYTVSVSFKIYTRNGAGLVKVHKIPATLVLSQSEVDRFQALVPQEAQNELLSRLFGNR
ncbi:MAG: hypothetical protein AAGJ10_05195, partial [Bacteroidota bacterium]